RTQLLHWPRSSVGMQGRPPRPSRGPTRPGPGVRDPAPAPRRRPWVRFPPAPPLPFPSQVFYSFDLRVLREKIPHYSSFLLARCQASSPKSSENLGLGFRLNWRLELRQVILAKLRNLGLDHNLAVGISPVSLIEFLMIIFSLVKCFEGNDLSNDRILPNLGSL